MPPKNSLNFGPGTLYFNTPEGLQPLGEVQDVEIEEEQESLPVDGASPLRIRKALGELTFTVQLATEAMQNLTEALKRSQCHEYWRTLCQNYPSRRVVHLANLHGDPLVRKKNIKRIMRYYETTIFYFKED